jgi:hypothetical protein
MLQLPQLSREWSEKAISLPRGFTQAGLIHGAAGAAESQVTAHLSRATVIW